MWILEENTAINKRSENEKIETSYSLFLISSTETTNMFIAYFLYYRGLINLREHKGIGGLIGGGDLLFICCMEFADLHQYKGVY